VTKIDFESIRKVWVTEASGSELGLWWLADDLREILDDKATEEEVRIATLRALKPLLGSGQLQATTSFEVGKFQRWSGDVDQQIHRIEEEWKTIGIPGIGDIVWFIGIR